MSQDQVEALTAKILFLQDCAAQSNALLECSGDDYSKVPPEVVKQKCGSFIADLAKCATDPRRTYHVIETALKMPQCHEQEAVLISCREKELVDSHKRCETQFLIAAQCGLEYLYDLVRKQQW